MKDNYKRVQGEWHGEAIAKCPVCGSAAAPWRYSETPESATMSVVMCDNGDSFGPQVTASTVLGGCLLYMPPEEFYHNRMVEAVTYWNAYAAVAAAAAALTAIRDHNELLLTFEKLFGTENAMGFYFVLEEDSLGLHYSPEQFEELVSNSPDPIHMQTYLPGGADGCLCTNQALYVAHKLPGRVQIYGFANSDNPSSLITREEIHPGGHDFALVDGRYIVDPWLKHIKSRPKWVYDLRGTEQDKADARNMYGPDLCWTLRPPYPTDPTFTPQPTKELPK